MVAARRSGWRDVRWSTHSMVIDADFRTHVAPATRISKPRLMDVSSSARELQLFCFLVHMPASITSGQVLSVGSGRVVQSDQLAV